jgi:hypothetical protein
MDEVRKPTNSVCYTPSSEPYRINIKIDHEETGWGDMDWIDLAQDRDQWRALVNTVMNIRLP